MHESAEGSRKLVLVLATLAVVLCMSLPPPEEVPLWTLRRVKLSPPPVVFFPSLLLFHTCGSTGPLEQYFLLMISEDSFQTGPL